MTRSGGQPQPINDVSKYFRVTPIWLAHTVPGAPIDSLERVLGMSRLTSVYQDDMYSVFGHSAMDENYQILLVGGT